MYDRDADTAKVREIRLNKDHVIGNEANALALFHESSQDFHHSERTAISIGRRKAMIDYENFYART